MISLLLNCSVATAHKQVKRIIKEGYAELQPNGNLKFKGVNKLKNESFDFVVQVPVMENKKSQIAAFRFAIVCRNLHSQKKKIEYKNQIVEKALSKFGRLSRKSMKMVREKKGIEGFRSSIQNRLTLSNEKFGKLTMRSSSMGKIYQKQFNLLGFIKSDSSWKKLCKCEKGLLHTVRQEYNCYYLTYHNGYAYYRLSNTINILPNA